MLASHRCGARRNNVVSPAVFRTAKNGLRICWCPLGGWKPEMSALCYADCSRARREAAAMFPARVFVFASRRLNWFSWRGKKNSLILTEVRCPLGFLTHSPLSLGVGETMLHNLVPCLKRMQQTQLSRQFSVLHFLPCDFLLSSQCCRELIADSLLIALMVDLYLSTSTCR